MSAKDRIASADVFGREFGSRSSFRRIGHRPFTVSSILLPRLGLVVAFDIIRLIRLTST